MTPRPTNLPDYRPQLVSWLAAQASMYGVTFAQFATQWISEHSHHSMGPYWQTYSNTGDYSWIVANLWGQVVSDPALYDWPELLCGNYAELMRQLYNVYSGRTDQTGLVIISARHSFDVEIDGEAFPSFQDHVVIEICEPGNGGRFGVYDVDYGVCYINQTGPYVGQVATLADLIRPQSTEEFRAALTPWAGPQDYGWDNLRVQTPLDPNALLAGDFFASVYSNRQRIAVTNTRRVNPEGLYVDSGGNLRPFRDYIMARLTAAGGTRGDHFEV